ncbi:hypothetical protein HL667_25330 [Bradyrhizobium sp. 83012]|uniref:SH3 domain-containing protein n=1 Tax=Bradyrhizobium aeschynomenes TaxID=2734909 RepID=A0ABX2CJJ6_9BRAD|nr:hypothetical protein [Bradyrhizobium aeschynomenes]NPU68348.1 hypothetical protein [Bradyrhizobium aeschynomenes]
MSQVIRLLRAVPVIMVASLLVPCAASAQSLERHGGAPVASDRGQAGRAAGPATYDPAVWFKADFWGREWPDGFTLNHDVTLPIRTRPEIGAPKTVDCMLRKGATYHPWNMKRVKADRLSFVTFTRISTYELKRDHSSDLLKISNDERVTIKFKIGDRWSAVGPGAEGFFLMRVGNDVYQGYQDMFDASAEIGGGLAASLEDDGHEWLQLRCANGAAGWIFYDEVKEAPGFSRTEACGYGCAEDRKLARRRSSPSGTTR